MEVSSKRWGRRLSGSVEVVEIPREKWNDAERRLPILAKYAYTWRPPYQVACQLPQGFALSFECLVDKSGFRRFAPAKPIGALLLEAGLAGHAIRSDRGIIERDQTFTQHEARLFLQFSRFTREYLGETVKVGQNLVVCRAGRTAAGATDILPSDVGIGANSKGKRWGPERLKREGRQAAHAAGIKRPTPDQVVSYGLLEAAQLNPSAPRVAGTRGLVRLALYAMGPEGDRVSRAAMAYVARQVQQSLKDHRDDNCEEFCQWIEDPKSNLLTRIAKRNDCRWSKEQIRMAMAELGWRSFKLLGDCIHTCMSAFADALPKPLTKAEETLFARIYLSQRVLGGIPLVLLHERFTFLKPAILETWNNPGSRPADGVLRKMLWYYAEIVSARRAADRQYKRASIHKNESHRPTINVPVRDEPESRRQSATPSLFDEIALRAARAREFACDFAGAEWRTRLVHENKTSVTIEITCLAIGFDEKLTIPRQEFVRLGEEASATS